MYVTWQSELSRAQHTGDKCDIHITFQMRKHLNVPNKPGDGAVAVVIKPLPEPEGSIKKDVSVSLSHSLLLCLPLYLSLSVSLSTIEECGLQQVENTLRGPIKIRATRYAGALLLPPSTYCTLCTIWGYVCIYVQSSRLNALDIDSPEKR